MRGQFRDAQLGEVAQAACGALLAALRRGVERAIENMQLAILAQVREQTFDQRARIYKILHAGGEHDDVEYLARQCHGLDVASDETQRRCMAEHACGLGELGAIDVDAADLALQRLGQQVR